MTGEQKLHLAFTIGAAEHGDEFTGQIIGGQPGRHVTFGHCIHHLPDHECKHRFTALGLHLFKGFGVQIGMHKIRTAVVDNIQLKIEIQRVFQKMLELTDATFCGLKWHGDAGIFGLDHFI